MFRRVGIGLGIPDLPETYAEWRADRERHLRRDLAHGEGTKALYAQYRKHLGLWRYHLLLRLQSILAPEHVRGLLRLKRAAWLRPLVRLYPVLVRAGLRPLIQWLLMPAKFLPPCGAWIIARRALRSRKSLAGDTRRAGAHG